MDVTVERAGHILIATLNRPDDNNAMTPEMFAGLLEAFSEAERSDIRVVITKAAGRNFCVGAAATDLRETLDQPMREVFSRSFEGRQGLPSLGGDAAQAMDDLGFNRWAWEFSRFRVPCIAMISGAAAGGGLALALLHHFRFADSVARFTTAFGRLGLGAELGASHLLPEIVGRQNALDMLLTNRVVTADEAIEIGLVDRLFPTDRLEAETLAFAEKICATPPLAARAALCSVMDARMDALKMAMQREWVRQQSLWGTPDFKAAVTTVLADMGRPKAS